jgi:hypothetical protein
MEDHVVVAADPVDVADQLIGAGVADQQVVEGAHHVVGPAQAAGPPAGPGQGVEDLGCAADAEHVADQQVVAGVAPLVAHRVVEGLHQVPTAAGAAGTMRKEGEVAQAGAAGRRVQLGLVLAVDVQDVADELVTAHAGEEQVVEAADDVVGAARAAEQGAHPGQRVELQVAIFDPEGVPDHLVAAWAVVDGVVVRGVGLVAQPGGGPEDLADPGLALEDQVGVADPRVLQVADQDVAAGPALDGVVRRIADQEVAAVGADDVHRHALLLRVAGGCARGEGA